MQQWRDVKSRHPDSFVFFRVGDFYEFFYEDAEEGARLLGLTLTSRNNGSAAAVPLAGVPVKAVDEYLDRLVRMGHRVAICEQVEDPALARGIVKREVVETVTPGTVLKDSLLTAARNTHVVALTAPDAGLRGVAIMDVSTGEFAIQTVAEAEVADRLASVDPAELVLPRTLETDGPPGGEDPVPVSYRPDWQFDRAVADEELCRHFGIRSLDSFGLTEDDGRAVEAAGALLAYVRELQPGALSHLRRPVRTRPGATMLLDEMTRRNLELVEPLRPGPDGGTLLGVVDRTRTPMGARLLRRWLLAPLLEPDDIWTRLDGVEGLADDPGARSDVREALGHVADLERLAGRIGAGRASPRDLVALRRSLDVLPEIAAGLTASVAPAVRALGEGVDTLGDVRERIGRALTDDPPAALQDGGVIRPGYDPELDELRTLRDGAVDFIASLQARERERTGIGSLKVGFNRVFGYYLEVTKANSARVPDDYVRKQTLTNAERYFTPELKQWEEKVFGAEDRIREVEAELFATVRLELAVAVPRLQRAAERVARTDVLAAFADLAVREAWVRPEVHTGFDLDIRAGRHPVVEAVTGRDAFIANDVSMTADRRVIILTGPNMAGKSTLLRQVGLIQLLAQIGCFVPADRARVPVADRIFTRVGASDNLVRGQSTFMVEMTETAAILHGAGERSLVLLDEIGRGTATFDGVSIAWAVTEELHEHIGAKTIFATHYHELTQLGDLLPAVVNMNVAVREAGDEIVFLRRLEDGGADRSYGIQVGRLAGLGPRVVARAREILEELEGTHSAGGAGLGRAGALRPRSTAPPDQLALPLARNPVLDELAALDPETLTPLEALVILSRLHDRIRS